MTSMYADAPKFSFNGSQTTPEELAKKGGTYYNFEGFAHVMLEMASVKNSGDDEDGCAHVELNWKVLVACTPKFVVDPSQKDKQFRDRWYLEKNTYGENPAVDEHGQVRYANDGTTALKEILGREPLVPGDKQLITLSKRVVEVGILQPSDVCGKNWELDLSLLVPGRQCILKTWMPKPKKNKRDDTPFAQVDRYYPTPYHPDCEKIVPFLHKADLNLWNPPALVQQPGSGAPNSQAAVAPPPPPPATLPW